MQGMFLSFPIVAETLNEPNSSTENLSFLLSILFLIGTATYIITRLINQGPLRLWERIILIIVAIAALTAFALWLILPKGGIGFA